MPENQKSPIKLNKTQIAIALSISLHLFFLISTYLIPQPKNLENLNIDLVDDNTKTQLEYLQQEPDPKKLVEFDKKEDDQKINSKAKYLAAKNNEVKKETIAKLDQNFKNVEKPTKGQPTENQRVAAEKSPWEKQDQDQPKLFNNGFDVYEKMQKKQQAKFIDKSNPTQTRQNNESTSTDRLDNVDQSLMTQLNTREYKYYGYYTRIRHQLNQWWQPKVKEKVSKLMSHGRSIASTENKNTKVVIILNDGGQLVKVQVLGASGVRELDDAAVEAFRQAAPFPNPPKGLVDADGTIKIRWDFIVES